MCQRGCPHVSGLNYAKGEEGGEASQSLALNGHTRIKQSPTTSNKENNPCSSVYSAACYYLHYAQAGDNLQ